MKCNEFKRWLKARGVEIAKSGAGSHFKLYYKGNQSILPHHGAKEMAEGTRKAIIKQLGLKD